MLQLFSQETDLFMKVIMKCVNIKLWDILSCFHYILNAPRIIAELNTNTAGTMGETTNKQLTQLE